MYEPDVDVLNARMYRKTAPGQPESWWNIFDKKHYLEAVQAFEAIKAQNYVGSVKYELDEGVAEDELDVFNPVGGYLDL